MPSGGRSLGIIGLVVTLAARMTMFDSECVLRRHHLAFHNRAQLFIQVRPCVES